jgi:trimethylamine--corrinoid protein Co-methyltransferase
MKQIKRPRLRILDDEDCRSIHGFALQMLKEIGMKIPDEDTRAGLKDVGCREKDDGYITFPEDIVQKTLQTVPERMVLYDQNGNVAVDTKDPGPKFAPGLNCINVLDYKTGKIRSSTLDDIIQTARLCERLDNIDMAANLGNPNDLPTEDQAIESVRALVTHTRKPLAFIAHDAEEAIRIWEYLAEVAGGMEALSNKPFAIDLTGPTSPFIIKPEACKRLRFAARHRLPVVCYPCLFPGITGPVTLAGAIAQSSAEIIAGIVIHQTETPGAPVVTGSAIVPMDMRTVNLAYGAPEYSLLGLAACDYFDSIDIPTWIGAGCSDAHIFDHQAASEAAAGLTSAVLSPTSFIHNLGFLSSGKTGSLEMLTLCDELAGMASRMVYGVGVNGETLATDVVSECGKNGDYLKHPHTKKHVREVMWLPSLFQRFGQSAWSQSANPETIARIREKLRDLLGE